MTHVAANHIELEYETFGDPADPAVLLIMGLGMQLLGWPEDFCRSLAAQGYFVIRFDNRDVGLSSHLDHLGKPKLLWAAMKHKLGLPIRPPYSLADMARDSLGLLDALHIQQAHIVGASMGGMIAQLLAIQAPQRTLSLTSIMSTTGDRTLPGPTKAAQIALLRGTPARLYHPAQREALIDFLQENWRVLHSPGFETASEMQRERIGKSLERSIYPQGVLRQLMAVVASPDRSPLLAHITAPTLVVHGSDDPLVPIACGRDTARKIPGAQFEEIPGMAHDMPPGVCARLVPLLAAHFAAATEPTEHPVQIAQAAMQLASDA